MLILFGILIGLGYTIAACLMLTLWSYIPPRNIRLTDIMISISWPIYLPLMIIAAFISSVIRAIEDQNGEFAGLPKKAKWVEEHKNG